MSAINAPVHLATVIRVDSYNFGNHLRVQVQALGDSSLPEVASMLIAPANGRPRFLSIEEYAKDGERASFVVPDADDIEPKRLAASILALG